MVRAAGSARSYRLVRGRRIKCLVGPAAGSGSRKGAMGRGCAEVDQAEVVQKRSRGRGGAAWGPEGSIQSKVCLVGHLAGRPPACCGAAGLTGDRRQGLAQLRSAGPIHGFPHQRNPVPDPDPDPGPTSSDHQLINSSIHFELAEIYHTKSSTPSTPILRRPDTPTMSPNRNLSPSPATRWSRSSLSSMLRPSRLSSIHESHT